MDLWTLLLLIAGQVIESKDFPKDMQMKAVSATVRIVNRTKRTEGTGVILGRYREGIYVLTAAHLILHASRFEISTYSAESYPHPLKSYERIEVLANTRDLRRDLILLRVSTEDRPPAEVHLCPLEQLPKDGKFEALSVGCGASKAPICLLESVSKDKQFRRLAMDTTRQWETELAQSPGRSGGPLLNKRGELIGLASGASEGKGYYCHGAEIHDWLKDSKYAFLLGEKEKQDKPAASTPSPRRDRTPQEKAAKPARNNFVKDFLKGENSDTIAVVLIGVLLGALLVWWGCWAIRRKWQRNSTGSKRRHRRHHHRSSDKEARSGGEGEPQQHRARSVSEDEPQQHRARSVSEDEPR